MTTYYTIDSFSVALNAGIVVENTSIRLNDSAGENNTEIIAEILQSGSCPQGLVIDLGENPLSTAKFQAIAQALQSGRCPQRLSIRLFETGITDAGVQAITQALQSGQCPRNLKIDLSSNDISSTSFQMIATALQSGHCPQGLEICLIDSGLIPSDAQTIALALQSGHCPQGLVLDLSNNDINFDGAQAIAKALQSGNCPQDLEINLALSNIDLTDLDDDSLVYTGIHALADALQSGRCPQGLKLNLSDNQLDDSLDTQAMVYVLIQALQSGKCPPRLQLIIDGLEDADIQTFVPAILSGKCPQDLGLYGIDIDFYLKEALTSLVTSNKNLHELGPSSSQDHDSDMQDWSSIFNAIRGVFCFNANLILADEQLKKTIHDVIDYYIRELQGNSVKLNKDDYCESYFPAFNEVANVILALYEVSQTANKDQKQWVSMLMLTLADCLLPQQPINWPSKLSLWVKAQRLIVIEKAFSLYPDNPTVLARHWQYFCDEFNAVSYKERIFAQQCDISSIKENPANTMAIGYYAQTLANGLFVLPPLSTQLGKRKRAEFESEFIASSAKTDFFRVAHKEKMGIYITGSSAKSLSK